MKTFAVKNEQSPGQDEIFAEAYENRPRIASAGRSRRHAASNLIY
jgi:hypothetical protein